MNAIATELSYVQPFPCGVFHTYWELLCNELFMQYVPGISEDETFDEVKVWHDATITCTKNNSPYTFTVVTDGGSAPKACDVILYINRYYIIGAVAAGAEENAYICSGCLAIDLSIVGVYVALLALQKSVSDSESERIEAESARASAESERVSAESDRVTAENGRVSAESQRVLDFNASQSARTAAYNTAEGTENGSVAGDGSRWGAYKSSEASRIAQMAILLTPWVVEGKLSSGEFVADDEHDTPATAKERWDGGMSTYLTIPNGRVEAITAADGDYLYTASWKWKYSEEE